MIIKIFNFLKTAFFFDLQQLRGRISLFFFNSVPDMMILSPIRNFLLKLGGMDITVRDAYIRSPFFSHNLKNIKIGRGVFINKNAYIDASESVFIGNNCQIGPYLKIENVNHDVSNHMQTIVKPVHINDQVWVGSNVLILPGVTIPSNSIIAGGAVVSKSFEDPGVYGGVPAQKIKEL